MCWTPHTVDIVHWTIFIHKHYILFRYKFWYLSTRYDDHLENQNSFIEYFYPNITITDLATVRWYKQCIIRTVYYTHSHTVCLSFTNQIQFSYISLTSYIRPMCIDTVWTRLFQQLALLILWKLLKLITRNKVQCIMLVIVFWQIQVISSLEEPALSYLLANKTSLPLECIQTLKWWI